jgi:hypothetical protein
MKDAVHNVLSTVPAANGSTAESDASAPPPGICLIIPKDSANKTNKQSFQDQLVGQAGASNLRTYTDNEDGPIMWKAILNTTQIQAFQKNPIADAVTINAELDVDGETADATTPTNATTKRSLDSRAITTRPDGLSVQIPAPELGVISHAPN